MTISARSSGLAVALLFAALCANANAAHRRQRRSPVPPTPSQSAKPSPNPTAAPLRPVVLIAGGTGTVEVTTGESFAVLQSAEIYDSVSRDFVPIRPMTARRDRQASVLLPGGKILIAGGADTALVPLVSFPGPSVPWILSSSELFDPVSWPFHGGGEHDGRAGRADRDAPYQW